VCDQNITNLFLFYRILSKILLVTTLLMAISSYSTPLFTHKVKTDYFSQKDPNISQTGNLLNINFSSSLTYGQKSDLCFWRVVRRFRPHFGVRKADGRTSIPSPFVSLTEIFGKDRAGFTFAIQKTPGLTENPFFNGRWWMKQSALHNRTIQFFDDQNKRQICQLSNKWIIQHWWVFWSLTFA